jgi:hypothetical protein
MNKSDTIQALAQALAKAQPEIKAALKDSTNPHFKSKYADLSSVIDAVKAPLLKHGISFLQGVEDAEGGVAVETMLLHTSGEWISSTMRIPATKQDAQGYGSAITYGRRYGLQAMCGVPAEDDDGNAATKATEAAKGTITPTSGVWDSMEPDMQTYLTDVANEVRGLLLDNNVKAACAHIQAQNLGADEKTALWTRFDSKERAAMKKYQDSLKKEPANV